MKDEFFPVNPMKAHERSRVLAPLIHGVKWSVELYAQAALPRGKNLSTHWIWNWVGCRAVQDLEEKSLAPAGIQTVDRPVRSLYQLSGQWKRFTRLPACNCSWDSTPERPRLKGVDHLMGDRRSGIRAADVQSDIWGRVPLGTWHVPAVVRAQGSGGSNTNSGRSNTISKPLAYITTQYQLLTVPYIRN